MPKQPKQTIPPTVETGQTGGSTPEPTAGLDPTNPNYYADLVPEPIDVIEGWELNFNLGTVVKYISRAGRKTPDPALDLSKAMWYLRRELHRVSETKTGRRKLTHP